LLSISPDGRTPYASGFESGDLATFVIAPDGGLTAIDSRVPAAHIPVSISQLDWRVIEGDP
jgi:hypothetical protein